MDDRGVALEARGATRITLPRVETAAAVVALVLVALLFLNVSGSNPPGFNRDEAAIAYNAYSLSSTGKDEYGARTPLFIRSFDDYKSPLYVYLLAGVYRVTGPSIAVARAFSAVLGLAAVLVIFVLALAISRRRWIAAAVTLIAGLGPWLFETSRTVFEVALMPLILALLYLVVYRAGTGIWRLRHSIVIGLLLTGLAYTYQVGRVVAPLLALGLLLCWYRQWRQMLVVCVVLFATAVVPIALWSHAHPGALEARYHGTTYITPGMSAGAVVWQYVKHYVDNLNLWKWGVHGDPDRSDHVKGFGSLLLVEIGLALAGIVIVILRRRSDPWWRFLLFSILISPIAASVTVGSLDTRRLVILAVVFPLLAIPALEAIAALPRQRVAGLAVAGLAAVFLVELVHWQVVYRQDGPKRTWQFDVGAKALVDQALRQNTTLYAFRGDHAVYPHLMLDGAIAGRSPSSTVTLDAYDSRPPAGARFLAMTGECPQCPVLLHDKSTSLVEYAYKPAEPGVVSTSFQLTSPLRNVGEPIDFTVWVDNKGAEPADHVILTVELPPTMRLTGVPYHELGTGCTHGSTIVCNIGWLPANTSTVIRYEVEIDRGGPQTMTSSIGTDKLEVNPDGGRAGYVVDLTAPAHSEPVSPSG